MLIVDVCHVGSALAKPDTLSRAVIAHMLLILFILTLV
ncbi:hypothetical protein PAUR_a2554 [Pseudoalteromonas aurantia 208]|uniref:Uncharacterized protein n=1 Tax=Pseudoalteromonas aurantia 208 TaxID=1314867 RepID=A0ABR9ECX2_9GAMM|nr:hypothetical protein [Pseudoalteromonas aurantia 208]